MNLVPEFTGSQGDNFQAIFQCIQCPIGDQSHQTHSGNGKSDIVAYGLSMGHHHVKNQCGDKNHFY